MEQVKQKRLGLRWRAAASLTKLKVVDAVGDIARRDDAPKRSGKSAPAGKQMEGCTIYLS